MTAQLGSLLIVGVFTIVVTALIALVAKAAVGMRVDEETETTGLDLAQHGERAYDMSS
jgi:Amt family ammonium transporter